MNDSLPSPRAELERKVTEYLMDQVNLCQTHRLEECDLSMIGKALWTVTAGLVDGNVSGFCADVANHHRQRIMVKRWVGHGKLITTLWDANTSGFIVQTIDTQTLKLQNKVIEGEVGDREPKLAAFFNSLSAAGYLETQ